MIIVLTVIMWQSSCWLGKIIRKSVDMCTALNFIFKTKIITEQSIRFFLTGLINMAIDLLLVWYAS